jgi:hypothetical protein
MSPLFMGFSLKQVAYITDLYLERRLDEGQGGEQIKPHTHRHR